MFCSGCIVNWVCVFSGFRVSLNFTADARIWYFCGSAGYLTIVLVPVLLLVPLSVNNDYYSLHLWCKYVTKRIWYFVAQLGIAPIVPIAHDPDTTTCSVSGGDPEVLAATGQRKQFWQSTWSRDDTELRSSISATVSTTIPRSDIDHTCSGWIHGESYVTPIVYFMEGNQSG